MKLPKMPNILGPYGEDPQDLRSRAPTYYDEGVDPAGTFMEAARKERDILLSLYDITYPADAVLLNKLRDLPLSKFIEALSERFKGEELPLFLFDVAVLVGAICKEHKDLINGKGSFAIISRPESQQEWELVLEDLRVVIRPETRADLLHSTNTACYYAEGYFNSSVRNIAGQFAQKAVKRGFLSVRVDLNVGEEMGLSFYRGDEESIRQNLSRFTANINDLRASLADVVEGMIRRQPERASLHAVAELIESLKTLSKGLGGSSFITNEPVDLLHILRVLNILRDPETAHQFGIHPRYLDLLLSKIQKEYSS